MKDSIQTRCEQFIRNRDRIKENFGWGKRLSVSPLCRYFYLKRKRGGGITAEELCGGF